MPTPELRVPRWLIPWVVPIALTVTVVLVAIFSAGVAIVFAVLCLVPLVVLRARDVKNHARETELVKRPFWKP
jgi:hypothetical protein